MISQEKIGKIKNLIEDNMVQFHNYEYRRYIDSYKEYIGDVTDRIKAIDDWQMNMSYPIAIMMVDTIFGTLYDFDYQLNIVQKDIEAACVRAYDFNNNGKRTLGLVAKEGLIVGKGIMRDFYFEEEGTYEALGYKVPYKISSPTMEYISVFNVMYDRMKGLNDSSYKIIRQFLSTDDIMKRIGLKDPEEKKKVRKQIDELKDTNNASFSMLNYEAIKGLMFSNKFVKNINESKNKKGSYSTSISEISKCSDLNTNLVEDGKFIFESSLYLNDFSYKNEIIEVMEGNFKHIFVNGTYILSKEINPHMFNLVAATFSEIPGSGVSMGVVEIISQISKMSTGMINMFLDSVKLGNTIMYKRKGGLKNGEPSIKIKSGQVLQGDVERVDLGGADFAGMNGVQALQGVAQSVLGVNQMIMGGDGRVQRVAGAFDFAFSQYKSRLTPFTDSIDMAMTKIIKGWIMQLVYFYSKQDLEKEYNIITEIVKGKGGKVEDVLLGGISITRILNQNNISFKFDSMYNMKKDANKKLAMDIFQLAQQYNNSKINGEAFIKLLAGDQSVTLEEVLGIDKEESELDELSKVVSPEGETSIDINGLLSGLDSVKKTTQTNSEEVSYDDSPAEGDTNYQQNNEDILLNDLL